MTPELSKKACEESKRLLAERKKQKEALRAERDAKLKSIGLDGSSDFIEEKLEEVAQISKSVEELAVKKAVQMLEKIPEASEAVASEAIASEAAQTSVVPTSNPTLSSSDSDLDDVPISQKLKILQKPFSTTLQTTLQEEQTSTVAEAPVDPEEPTFTDLPTCDSPLNLHSLEKHLGGELQETPEKATTSVSKQTDIVNQQQQQPEPSNQTTFEQTSTSTQLTQTQTTHSPQKAIPEPFVETVVSESVPVIESGPSVAITVSDPTKKQQTTNDQPSSSSTIQTPKTTITHLLKSEVLESEVMNMHAELQSLVQLRRSSALADDYQGRWASLKDRTSELLDTVSQQCIKIQQAAIVHRTKPVQLIKEDPLLLAYTPFYCKSDYLTREGRILKQVKEEAMKEKAAAKAREDLLIQKQLEMEAAFKQQADLLAQLMNKQT